MTGAIGFLRKKRAICKNIKTCTKCPIKKWCEEGTPESSDEAEFVRTVMDYEIKEESNNNYEDDIAEWLDGPVSDNN